MKTTTEILIGITLAALLAACTATHTDRTKDFADDPVVQFLKQRDELINDYTNDAAVKLFAPDAEIALSFDYVTYPPHQVSAVEFLQFFTSRSEEKRCGRKIFMHLKTTPIHIKTGTNGKTATVESAIEITSRTVLTKRILQQQLSETLQLDLGGTTPLIRSASVAIGREAIEPDKQTKSILAKTNSRAGLDEAEAIRLLEAAGFMHKTRIADGMVDIGPDKRSDALDHYGDEIPALASQIPGVRTLTIWMCGFGHVTDSGLTLLSHMDSLQELAVCSTEVTGKGIKNLAAAPNLSSLALCSTSITDEDCDSLARLNKLTHLKIVGTHITDEGLPYISKMQNLESLALSNMPITDNGLVHIAKLKNLEHLKLNMPTITDAGLVHLEAMTHLKTLEIRGTRATHDGADRLLRNNPGLKVLLPSLSKPPTKTPETQP